VIYLHVLTILKVRLGLDHPPRDCEIEIAYSRIAKFFSEAINLAREGSNPVAAVDLSESRRTLGQLTEQITEIMRLHQSLTSLLSDLPPANSLSRTLSLEENEDRHISQTISDLNVELATMDREIEFLKINNKRLDDRLALLKATRKPVPATPNESRSQQMSELDNLYIEYSKVWRNICFVEYHLKKLDDSAMAPVHSVTCCNDEVNLDDDDDIVLFRDISC
jgi:regulator of replication initiation timing